MKGFLLGLIFICYFNSAFGMNHVGMLMDDKGMIMNSNSDNLPKDCPNISETLDVTIKAGHQYALKFPGKMFAFDTQEINLKPCSKLNITFINTDQIRHQLMIHGLPGYLYSEGMFHLELYGEGQLQASVIFPSQKKTYLMHCELPQHMEKGMKSQIKVDGGDGDLPSIPGVSAPVRADFYKINWNQLAIGIIGLSILLGVAIVLITVNYAEKISAMGNKILTKFKPKN